MATRHPGVRRWRVKPVDRPQEINATTSHTYRRHAPGGGLPLPLHQGSVGFLSGGDSPTGKTDRTVTGPLDQARIRSRTFPAGRPHQARTTDHAEDNSRKAGSVA
jgi:hypothetical protein